MGESVRARLSDGADLAAIAIQIAEVARGRGAEAVFGASTDGDRLAGAAALASSGGLRLWREGDQASGVLIVDSVLVSGVHIARARTSLRAFGVATVSAAVVAATEEALGQARAELRLSIDALDTQPGAKTPSGAANVGAEG
jgi:adenine/guanine phosphoribosyltransferase-like PRPP-binding protein